MVYAEFSIHFEAITPVTYVQDDTDTTIPDYQEYNLLPGEKPDPSGYHYYNEVQADNMDENLPLMPQIAERIYGSAEKISEEQESGNQGWYIKSGLIKVTIHHHSSPDYTFPFTDFIGTSYSNMETAEEANAIYAEKMEYSTNVMEFQSQLNEAIKQYYELRNINFIINYNQKSPKVIQ